MVIPGLSAFPSSAAAHGVAAAIAANNACAGAPCNSLFAPNLPKQYVASTTQPSRASASPIRSIQRSWCARAPGASLRNKGLLDNVFPGGNSPFQPTETVYSSGSTDLVDNPGVSVTTGVEPASHHHQPQPPSGSADALELEPDHRAGDPASAIGLPDCVRGSPRISQLGCGRHQPGTGRCPPGQSRRQISLISAPTGASPPSSRSRAG